MWRPFGLNISLNALVNIFQIHITHIKYVFIPFEMVYVMRIFSLYLPIYFVGPKPPNLSASECDLNLGVYYAHLAPSLVQLPLRGWPKPKPKSKPPIPFSFGAEGGGGREVLWQLLYALTAQKPVSTGK